MPYPPRYLRRNNFASDKANGVVFDESKVDIDLNDAVQSLQVVNDFIRAGFNADKTLKPFTSTDAMDLLSLTTFTATTGQTAFTAPTYNTSLDSVIAFANADFIPQSGITRTNTTTVTLAAQTAGTVITILIFTSGSGTLSRLADTVTADEGAALVGIRDAGGLFTATTVEDGLAEVAGDLNTLSTALGTLARYILRDGSVAFTANQPMGGFILTGLGAGTSNGHSVRYEQLTAVVAQLNGVTSGFLPKTGGTMSGVIDHGAQRATNIATPTASTDAANKAYVDAQLISFGGLPIGAVTAHAGALPSGWLNCDGTAVSRTTYANLFAVIGVTFGVGDGTTTFNIPDVQGRVVIGLGAGSGLTARSMNDSGGEENHVLAVTELPAHTHTITGQSGGGGVGPSATGSSSASTYTSSSTGGGLGHNTMQPYRALRVIIKY